MSVLFILNIFTDKVCLQNTVAVTVIVQRHSIFLTEQAYAYSLRCHYPTPVRTPHSHFYVTELVPSNMEIGGRGPEPQCYLDVMDIDDTHVTAATVGQALKISLTIQPNKTYAILPRNCFAINMESGERYSLTDSAGCSIDTNIFPEWTRVRPYLAQVKKIEKILIKIFRRYFEHSNGLMLQ